MYARSLLRGFSFEERGRDDALRQRLFQEAEDQGIDALYQRLERLDPKAAEEIHPHNVKRVIRALEYIQLCGEPFSAQAERSHSAQSPYQYVMLCLGYENRETLYRRIDARVDKMLEQGLLPEAQAFYSRCQQAGSIPTAAQAIGYKELFPYFRGEVSLEEAVEAALRGGVTILQLREKQKAKFIYGVLEKPFRNYYKKADRMKGMTGENLMTMLEARLDSVVFRMGFARTRREARQVVDHKHILVNGKCVNIPSYQVKAGDVIEVKESAKTMQRYKDILEVTAGRLTPEWMDVEKEAFKGTVKQLPTREMIDVPVDEMLIVELYSK